MVMSMHLIGLNGCIILLLSSLGLHSVIVYPVEASLLCWLGHCQHSCVR